ncbi:uncharacterized protein LOC134271961 [Saccostrea cucullata]|uniref:uncharacterized protein LOC134271961 n=1 Tax=Saccostrea cuccullata TaxID=36930 RepID=UPI002ED13845
MSGAVVVTDRTGRYRFTYTGPPSGSNLTPRGIRTGALSNILICDDETLQMIDKDGNFMLQLHTQQQGLNGPRGVSYDDKYHLLCVGSCKNNTVGVYRFIERQTSFTALFITFVNANNMDTLKFSTQCKERQCFQCQGDTEFYCNTCEYDLCLLCKERHVIDLDTKNHDVVIYREKYKYIYSQETCVKHPESIYIFFCYSCKLPFCFKCRGHVNHALMDIGTAYKMNRFTYRQIIHNIRSETIYKSLCLLVGIKSDMKTWHSEVYNRQSWILKRAQRLKSIINIEINDAQIRNRSYPQRLQIVMWNINAYLAIMEKYQYRSEQSERRPVKFLLFIKKFCVSKRRNTPRLTQHVLPILTKEINFEDLIITLMSSFQMIKGTEMVGTGKRQVNNKYLLKPMSSLVLQRSLTAKGVSCVKHITIKTSGQIWINDINNLNLTNIVGDILCHVPDISSYWGVHTVSMTSDLIYIGKNHHIIKISKDNRSKTLIKKTESWEPQCVYCSASNGDLLVGMWNTDTFQGGKVVRYSHTIQHIQTIQHNSNGHEIYSFPRYITENWNGDIIVSDFLRRAVVVVDYGGRHRFSYTGPELGVIISPYGVCTDALSHILICDQFSNTVQMIDKDGNFLSVILTQEDGINKPCSLDYDDITHLLWVGSINNNSICVYRHISRHEVKHI